MLLEILVGVCIAAVIAYLIETIKMQKAIHRIVQLNKVVLEVINPMIDPLDEVNVFVVNDIRHKLIDQFVKPHVIDEVKVYMVDHDQMRLLYRKGLAVQKLDIYVRDKEHAIRDVSVEYHDNPFEPEGIQ